MGNTGPLAVIGASGLDAYLANTKRISASENANIYP